MKTIAMVVAGLMILGTTCRAGEIYGALSEGGKPLAAGTKVEIVTSAKTYETMTDKFGSYRLFGQNVRSRAAAPRLRIVTSSGWNRGTYGRQY